MRKNKQSISIVMLFAILNFSIVTPLFAATVQVQSGTYIQLELTESLSSDDVTSGKSVNFRVTTPLMFDGKTVVAAGATARGVVDTADGAGIIGSEGELGISLKSVTAVDGTQIPISATKFIKGQNKAMTSLVVGLFLCFPFLFMKGGEAELQSGSVVEAMIIGSPQVTVD